jgi:predicted pyridoxine 5'-phosphate oxidase superfamily flavin-nucleotide-binding protein
MAMYHRGSRELQSRFGSEALADRLVEKTHRTRFTAEDRAFIESVDFFFLATADGEAQPDCSFKGGAPGFVRVVAPDLLAYPDYDGNGMFKSLGNLKVNSKVGLLFIAMGEKPKRLRVNGIAELSFDDPLLADFPGGQMLVRIAPTHIFPNCPRYIPHMQPIQPRATSRRQAVRPSNRPGRASPISRNWCRRANQRHDLKLGCWQ